jgi:preprotein translocase subunit SecG
MTKSQRAWRDKKIKKIRVYKKIHNSFLRGITGVMAVFFLLSLLCLDNVNKYVILMFVISITWLSIFAYANNLDHVEEGEE